MIKKKYLIIVSTLLALVCAFNIGTILYYNNTSKNLKIAKNQIMTIQNELNNTQAELQIEVNKNNELSESLDVANTVVTDLKNTEYDLVYLGDFKLTHYCNEQYEHICGNGDGFTATGTQTTVGRTIAVDPAIIPYGTEVYIEGYGWRVAEDCGGGVNQKHIDILVDRHAQAESIGVKNGGVWILVKQS